MATPKKGTDEGKKQSAGLGFVPLALLSVSAVASSFAGVYLFGGQSAPQNTLSCPTESPTRYRNESLVDKDMDYVSLGELTVSVGGGTSSRFVKLEISVITPNGKTKDVESAAAILLDAFSDYLRSVNPADFEDPAFYPRMKQQLARRAEIILGPPGSHGILITEFLLR